ncbi:unnamed protein product [Leuciscus chuanchicus]
MASRMGLVRGDFVVGKKQFSSLLKAVYPTAVTAQNIKAGFRKAGIFPLSRGAVDTTQVVRVLPSVDARPSSAPVTTSDTPSITLVTPSATPSFAPVTPSDTPSGAPATLTHTYSDNTTDTQTSNTPSTTPTPFPTCKRGIPKNYLVAAGVIPESLANVLMSPALDRREKVRRRLPLPARVITSDEYVRLLEQKEAEEKEKEEKKRKCKEDMAKKKEEKTQAQEAKRQKIQAPPPIEEDGKHCAVCSRVVPPGSGDGAIDEWQGNSNFSASISMLQMCLFVGPGTLKFKTVQQDITEEAENQAYHALCPSSPMMSGEEEDIFSKGGYLSLQGKIMELRGVKMTRTNVPVLDIQLQCGGKVFEVSLWRDEALTDIYVGDEVLITHLRPCIIHNGRGS